MQPAWHTPERAAPKQAATILSITFTTERRTYSIKSISVDAYAYCLTRAPDVKTHPCA